MKRESSKECSVSFLWANESFSLWSCSFEEFNLVFFTADQSPWLVLSQPTQWGFWRNVVNGTFCTLWSRKVRFWKRIFVFVKFSSTFSTFWHRRDRKLQSALEIDFLKFPFLIFVFIFRFVLFVYFLLELTPI